MSKKLSGFLSFLPLILCIVSIVLFGVLFALNYDKQIEGPVMVGLVISIILMLLSVVALYAVMAWMIYIVNKRSELKDGKKAYWIIMLYMLNMFVFPVFWYKYILKG